MADRGGDVEPPELAAVLNLAERPRVGDWSLRAALTRYAQPEPQRVSDLLDLVRRIEVVLPGLVDVAARHGSALWQAANGGDADGSDLPPLAVGLLSVMIEIDGLGDRLAAWAHEWSLDRPDAAVDDVITDVRERLASLGVPEQERPGPPRGRSRG